MASMAASGRREPAMKMTGMCGSMRRRRRQTSSPDGSGRPRARRTTSGDSLRTMFQRGVAGAGRPHAMRGGGERRRSCSGVRAESSPTRSRRAAAPSSGRVADAADNPQFRDGACFLVRRERWETAGRAMRRRRSSAARLAGASRKQCSVERPGSRFGGRDETCHPPRWDDAGARARRTCAVHCCRRRHCRASFVSARTLLSVAG